MKNEHRIMDTIEIVFKTFWYAAAAQMRQFVMSITKDKERTNKAVIKYTLRKNQKLWAAYTRNRVLNLQKTIPLNPPPSKPIDIPRKRPW